MSTNEDFTGAVEDIGIAIIMDGNELGVGEGSTVTGDSVSVFVMDGVCIIITVDRVGAVGSPPGVLSGAFVGG